MNVFLVASLACVFGVVLGTIWATHVLTKHFDARLESRDQMWRDALTKVNDRVTS